VPTPAGPAPQASAATTNNTTAGSVSDCTSGLANINVSFVAARRYPLVDEEQGVVLALGIFQRKSGTTTRRNALTEWFYFENNKIKTIYSSMFYPAPDAAIPNWPPYEPNWPMQVPVPVAAPAVGQR
jgi:hypothetical protein